MRRSLRILGWFALPAFAAWIGSTSFAESPSAAAPGGLGEIRFAETQLVASDGSAGDEFGFSVDVDGGVAVVGARQNDAIGVGAGAAYVFVLDRGRWVRQARLLAEDGAAGDRFGSSVAIEGDRIVIGAPENDAACPSEPLCNSGAAYFFERVGEVWTLTAKLTPLDAAAGDRFGTSVSISAGWILIGAPQDDDLGESTGAAYVFADMGSVPIEQIKLTALDAAAGDFFGFSVDVDEGTAVVGAFGDDDGGPTSGSAYVFTEESGAWTQQAKLVASDARIDDQFGSSVAIGGPTIAVGAFDHDDLGTRSGAVFVFIDEAGTWSERVKLLAGDGAAGDQFGFSVAVDGARILVGAPRDNDAGRASGSAYLFTRVGETWREEAEIAASGARSHDEFGLAVALDGARAVAGAYLADPRGPDSGAAYVFDLSTPLTVRAMWPLYE